MFISKILCICESMHIHLSINIWVCVRVKGLPSVLSAVAEEFDHIGQEKASYLHELGAGGGAFEQSSHNLQNHWEAGKI